MSAIGDFFKNLGRTLMSPINKLFGTGTTQAQYEQNEWQSEEAEINRVFQSNEAALQRDWSSQEAERARDWNEEMYEKYNSLSGKIAQAEQAGVNPLFAVTGNSVSPMSTSSSAPSGAAATGGAMPASSAGASESFVNLIGQLLGAKKINSEIAVNESIANKNNADAEGSRITNESLRDMNAAEIMSKLSQITLNESNVQLIASKVLNTDADTSVKAAQLGQIASQVANTDADTAVKQKQIALISSEILKNTKSLDVMDAQIAEMASSVGMNRAKAGEIAQNIRNMVQDYNFEKVANELRTMVMSSEATDANFRNPANYSGVARVARQVLNEIEDLFNFSGTSTPK